MLEPVLDLSHNKSLSEITKLHESYLILVALFKVLNFLEFCKDR